jgi:hypothetical protein
VSVHVWLYLLAFGIILSKSTDLIPWHHRIISTRSFLQGNRYGRLANLQSPDARTNSFANSDPYCSCHESRDNSRTH